MEFTSGIVSERGTSMSDYRQIRDALNELSEEQLDMTANVYEPEMTF